LIATLYFSENTGIPAATYYANQDTKKNLKKFTRVCVHVLKLCEVLVFGVEVNQHYTEIHLEWKTFSHVLLIPVQWTDISQIINHMQLAK
jgi:hypothetical protein